MSTDVLPLEQQQEQKPHRRGGGVWSYISPSRLNLWIKCPLAFRFRYLDGIRSPSTPSLFLGKVVHGSLEVWYRNRQLGIGLELDDLASRLDASWDEMVEEETIEFDSEQKQTDLKQKAVGLVGAYIKRVPEDEAAPLAVEAAMEVPLVDPRTDEDLGIPLLGIVDLILDKPEGASIIDFKTAARATPLLEIGHEVQLTSYAYMFRRLTGQQESGLEIRRLVKTKEPKIEFWNYSVRTEDHFGRLFSLVRAYLDDLTAGRFVYHPCWSCGMCEFRTTHCQAWRG
jgi:putative RecB family exonuclease